MERDFSDFKKCYLTTRDFFLSGESFDLLIDEELELLKTDPIPHNLSDYYKSDNYISHSDTGGGVFGVVYRWVKWWSIKRKISLVKNFKKEGKLLDIGSGTGEFLLKAKKRGYQVKGVEPDAASRELAGKKGLEVTEQLDGIQEKFDVITMWHALEHIPDLKKTIEHLQQLLLAGGYLVVAVPNHKSYDASYYGEFWAAFDVPRHIWHFSQKSISELFKKHFELVKVKPLVFDSFYVSLLSEKYAKGKRFSLRGIWIGLKSNLCARRSGEYSSLIYILEKK